jgi:phosphoglycerol transferase MdoB-like AlkP superfamily enzyme
MNKMKKKGASHNWKRKRKKKTRCSAHTHTPQNNKKRRLEGKQKKGRKIIKETPFGIFQVFLFLSLSLSLSLSAFVGPSTSIENSPAHTNPRLAFDAATMTRNPSLLFLFLLLLLLFSPVQFIPSWHLFLSLSLSLSLSNVL